MTTWNLQQTRCHLLICNGGSCMKRGAEEVTQAIREEITKLDADNVIHTTRTRCNGRCADACVVIAYPDGVWYRDITRETGRQLVRKYMEGQLLEEQIVYSFEREFIASGRSIQGIAKG
ncbi:(2Fe-2S) ferredoxin domain-containing protein [Paenibacillus silviterrae]|uniref:(2Fe-2S) ferredoxin domain-containing protein n=1 Tax=Paenibacillus silviterrae TaxID=3242194 RepID=UPI002542DF85|nr:(2Fe-2S) ferredoxin domain-containing protein [Paenibacillus chinjuensis]